jgi:TonB dependent receptor/Carboxypeptidase regulatory-like domain/TonB-dependent Receptor Plug Domain
MPRFKFCSLVLLLLLCAALAHAEIFGTVRGVVHDPQHRPVSGAEVKIKSATSEWNKTAQTDQDGAFSIAAVPIGDYIVTVTQSGFAPSQQSVTVVSETAPVLHFQLKIGSLSQTATVSAEAESTATTDSVTPTTLVSRQDIAEVPGADRTNSLQMITDFVPGSYFTHDQLHIRGGHQVSWLLDGVPIPNTNIASNLGPQIDPKDIDYLEALRGSYNSEYGDRTYGVFNVVPRSGFERNNEAELVVALGNWDQTNDQINFGGHTQRFAYFASFNGNRSDLGLQTPIGQVFHDAENGFGGFGSLIFNVTPKDQFRIVAQLRRDYYQIPFDPNANDVENQLVPSSGLRDSDVEADSLVDFSWVRTINSNTVLTVSPFFHYNSANYNGRPNDNPVDTTDHRGSTYGGAQTTFSTSFARNDVQVGVYGFGQRDNQLFGLLFNPPSTCPSPPVNGTCQFSERDLASGGLVSGFIDDKFKVTSWLTLMAGMRPTHFTGAISEDTISPRFGVAAQVPRLKWVFRAFYGHYYQAPPLLSVSGPLIQLCQISNCGFLPLHGERDEESQFGVTIPYRGWTLDIDTFKTRANNFFDHNNLLNSDVFFPITIDGALIRGWETTVRSPRLWNRGQLHLAYSNQVALARGAITGGLTNFTFPALGYGPLDHDQRNTLNVGFDAALPWRSYASTNVYYGSGFTNGLLGTPQQQFPGSHLPGHTTFDLSIGKSFAEKYTVSVTALNVANRRVQLDNSLTFGGFHFNDPREIYAEFRWRFHY